MKIEDLSKEELLKLLKVYAHNWLAHDGCWFLAAEEKYGMETAIELDTKSWERFSPAEAKRIMREFDLPENGDLDALEKALDLRLYAMVNKQHAERKDKNTLLFTMKECRVQKTRRKKGLPDFPCKQVGLVEYSKFAETIDPTIKTNCVKCPPDEVNEEYCVWEFKTD